MPPSLQVLAVAFVLPILQKDDEFGATDAQNAVLSSVIFIGMLFGSYGWGGFADIVGRRFVLLVSLTLNGIFGAVSAFSPNIAIFIVCRFFSGVGWVIDSHVTVSALLLCVISTPHSTL